MSFAPLYRHYQSTGDFAPLLDNAAKEGDWGQTSAPYAPELLPTGQRLLRRLADAFQNKPLPAQFFYADWSTLPR